MPAFPVYPPPARSAVGEDRRVERRSFVRADPRATWAALHDEENVRRVYPELELGPAEPAWPAVGSTRLARLRIGLLREPVFLESLEARPGRSFRVRLVGSDVRGEISWYLTAVAGGTRILHVMTLEPTDLVAGVLLRLTGRSLAARVEGHLDALGGCLREGKMAGRSG
jgi:hypothetical protein